jgi:zinc D-Ala-D-Ala carboxypeptidase
MNLSAHFTLAELTSSDYAERHGISNTPTDPEVLENLQILASGLERIREVLEGRAIFVNSGYRSPKLNTAIGGSKNSAHMKGLAADIRVAGMTPREVCLVLSNRMDELALDQIIFEGTWSHLGFADVDQTPRHEVLTAVFKPGQPTKYVMGVA